MADWQIQVNTLIAKADALEQQGHITDALDLFEKAYELIPEPKYTSELAMMALSSIGELNFLHNKWDYAFEDFSEAVKCKDGLGNPHIHLRLGQLQYERGNRERATDELMRAYMGAGRDIFANEDPKYFGLIKDYVEVE